MAPDTKRKRVNLSLTPEEGEAIERECAKTGGLPTTFATNLYRYAFVKYLRANANLQSLLDEVRTDGKVPFALSKSEPVVAGSKKK